MSYDYQKVLTKIEFMERSKNRIMANDIKFLSYVFENIGFDENFNLEDVKEFKMFWTKNGYKSYYGPMSCQRLENQGYLLFEDDNWCLSITGMERLNYIENERLEVRRISIKAPTKTKIGYAGEYCEF